MIERCTYLIAKPPADEFVSPITGDRVSPLQLFITRNRLDFPSRYTDLADLSRTRRCQVLIEGPDELMDSGLPNVMCGRLGNYLAHEKDRVTTITTRPGIVGKAQLGLLDVSRKLPTKTVRKLIALVVESTANVHQSRCKYDCINFAHELNGIWFEDGMFDWRVWRKLHWNGESDLPPGRTLIIKEDSDIVHMAIALRNKLFLSKIGTTKLSVMDLPNMIKMYGGSTYCAAEPCS